MATITMDDSLVTSIEHVKEFLKLGQEFQFRIPNKKGRYQWIEKTLRVFSYHRLKKKKERSLVRRYIRTVTGISNGQLTRLIKKHKKVGKIVPNYSKNKQNGFHTVYGPEDVALLIKTDAAHHHLSGEATKKILRREFEVFHHTEYETISKISPGYIYVIRNKNR